MTKPLFPDVARGVCRLVQVQIVENGKGWSQVVGKTPKEYVFINIANK